MKNTIKITGKFIVINPDSAGSLCQGLHFTYCNLIKDVLIKNQPLVKREHPQ